MRGSQLKGLLMVSNVIVGLGETGLSYARFLAARDEAFVVLDDAVKSDRLALLRAISPDATVGPIVGDVISVAKKIYVSPGVPLGLPALADHTTHDRLFGDVQLFGQIVQAPFVAVTGTNGKSTVTQLFHDIAKKQTGRVALGGNFGTPCLDLLSSDVDLYVLEVSSYQLELANNLAADVAVLLNLSADHLDRYSSEQAYFKTKFAIYNNCRSAVVNRAISCSLDPSIRVVSIGMDEADGDDEFALLGDAITLSGEVLLKQDELKLSGRHNLLNIQAALAIGLLFDFDMSTMLEVVKGFSGLPHRSEFVAHIGGVRYVNDSKGTNPGAMIAAVSGEASERNVHLIAGGVSKSADFARLQDTIGRYIKRAYLIGDAAPLLYSALPEIDCAIYTGLPDALKDARNIADSGDVVLLSPGCASFDQFTDFAARGETFRQIVERFES
jgi:UDP-N-acetylmuramoylalanine--D-glutamate ligase